MEENNSEDKKLMQAVENVITWETSFRISHN